MESETEFKAGDEVEAWDFHDCPEYAAKFTGTWKITEIITQFNQKYAQCEQGDRKGQMFYLWRLRKVGSAATKSIIGKRWQLQASKLFFTIIGENPANATVRFRLENGTVSDWLPLSDLRDIAKEAS
jgi:hypothetical protein